MKVAKIELAGVPAFVVNFADAAAATDSIVIEEIEGLGPPEHDVTITPTLNRGGVYGGKSARLRQLVVKGRLNPNYAAGETVESLRVKVYGMFGRPLISVRFMDINNAYLGAIVGSASKMDAGIFNKDSKFSVTIECTTAHIEAYTETVIDPATLIKPSPEFMNTGSVETGIRLEWTFNNVLPAEYAGGMQITASIVPNRVMKFVRPLVPGDKIVMDTRSGVRKITLNGSETDILGSITALTGWHTMLPGLNRWNFQKLNGSLLTAGNFTINSASYLPLYLGV